MARSMRVLSRIFPFLNWLRGYDLPRLQADLFAGLTVALVLIPQSMAYAQLAGLPAHYGLYAAFLPPLVGALFGSSQQLATGPVAVISLMTATALEPLATAGSEAYIAYAILLALGVGLFQFLLGVLRLGLVVNLLSHPVVIGFTNAAVIIIAVSQLPKLFGITLESGGHPLAAVMALFKAVPQQTHWPTLAMALLAFAVMVLLRRRDARIPNILVAVILTTALAWVLGYERQQQVGLDRLAEPTVQALVREMNSTLADVEQFTAHRLTLAAGIKREESKAAPDRVALLELRYRQELLELEIGQAKETLQQQRRALRSLRFVEVEGEGLYFPLERVASETTAHGPLWRLQIGTGALNVEKVPLAGGGAVVGAIPQGLPDFRVPALDFGIFLQLLPYAMIISLLGFMEAISIARALAAKTGQKLDANQELIGQGLANIVGSAAGSYAVSGSFSRSAVNLQAGGLTGLANVLSSLFVLLTLLLFTPLLHHLPQAVLAAIIIMAVIGLVQVRGIIHAWKAQKSDGVIAVITFIATLAFAPHLDKGIGLGVVLSVALFLHKKMRPRVATLAMSQEGVLQCADEHRLQLCAHIAAVRFDGTLFFANASFLDEEVFRIRSANPDLRHILLVADGINDMDASGEEALGLLVERVRSAGLGFALCRVKENVLSVLRRTGLLERIGAENIYASEEAALDEIIRITHQPQPDGRPGCLACPLVHHLPKPPSEGKEDNGNGFLPPVTKARKLVHEVVTSMGAGL
ncbi:MAG: SulP family inorganic anion transporter [Thermodesulfobacteriota bacterium]